MYHVLSLSVQIAMVGRNRSKPADENAARADDLLRQQVSKNIRALLISARNGLSVAEMQRDYHNMLGKPLPFREMGYTTLLDLLKDLPNVTRPTWENGVLVLKGELCIHVHISEGSKVCRVITTWRELQS